MCWYLLRRRCRWSKARSCPRFATLADCGVGKKAIAREVGVARNTVRRYLRQPIDAGGQVRPAARRLTDERRQEARDAVRRAGGGQCGRRPAAARRAWAARSASGRLSGRWPTFDASDGWRSWRRCASKRRRAISCKSISVRSACRSPACASASSSWSRCSATRAASSSKRSSMSAATTGAKGSPRRFTHFGGVPRTLLGDNARPLVPARDRATGHGDLPSGLSGLLPRLGRAAARVRAVSRPDQGQDRSRREIREAQCARRPGLRLVRRARAAPGRVDGDRRSRATTGPPTKRRSSASTATSARCCGPLPARALPRREQRLRRRVAHRCLRRRRHGPLQRAASPRAGPRRRRHRRADRSRSSTGRRSSRRTRDRREPYARVVDPAHFDGLWRRPAAVTEDAAPAPLAVLGRDLAEYAAIVAGGDQ